MKSSLTKLCWPVLKFFETGIESANYKKSHRVALNVLGSLFIILSFAAAWAAIASGGLGGFIPVVVFFGLGVVAVIVGTLGSSRAVSKIWGTK